MAISARLLNSVKVCYASMWTERRKIDPRVISRLPISHPLSLAHSPHPQFASPVIYREACDRVTSVRRKEKAVEGLPRRCACGFSCSHLWDLLSEPTAHKKHFSDETTTTGQGSCCNCTNPSQHALGICFRDFQAWILSYQVTKFFLLRIYWKTSTCGDQGGACPLIKRERPPGMTRPRHRSEGKDLCKEAAQTLHPAFWYARPHSLTLPFHTGPSARLHPAAHSLLGQPCGQPLRITKAMERG